jgi:hypothetical protein
LTYDQKIVNLLTDLLTDLLASLGELGEPGWLAPE